MKNKELAKQIGAAVKKGGDFGFLVYLDKKNNKWVIMDCNPDPNPMYVTATAEAMIDMVTRLCPEKE